MKLLHLFSVSISLFAASFSFGAEAAASAPAATATTAAQRRAAGLLRELKLTDAVQESHTRAILESHFTAMEQWHTTNDPALTTLWADWAAERNKPDRGEAVAVADKIDAVYAGFRPQRDAFLAALAREISAEQIETIKNTVTRSPGMDRTANAYIEMIPQFTEADRAFVRERFRLARDMAIDTTTGREIEAFFKRQKDIVEAYIDAQGYDYRKSRAAWIARMKAEEEAAKATPAKAGE